MSFMFPKTKAVKAPPLVAPPAIPQVGPDTEDWAMKQAKARSGFAKTLVTGSLSPVTTGKKKLLGG
jgi:hypothetical protein